MVYIYIYMCFCGVSHPTSLSLLDSLCFSLPYFYMDLVSKFFFVPIFIVVALSQTESVIGSSYRVRANKQGTASLAHEDLVTDLPGQPDVNFRHYAGYVTANKAKGRALFYWFHEASAQPNDKPLVLWLNGGPGCSSVGYGATEEIGPFLVDSNGLIFNPYAWNREANILFVESPVGVGFSYTNTTSDYDDLGDHFAASDAYAFLHNWFVKFPSYRNKAFYIAGESYAGIYIPQLAELIYARNKDPSMYIDLKGILMGNPETSEPHDWRGYVDYAWSHAVISDETHKTIKETCDFDGYAWSNKECVAAVAELEKQYKEIDMYSLYTSVCTESSSTSSTFEKVPRTIGSYDPCVDQYAKAFYNRPDVQKALHASDGTQLKNWSICNSTVLNNWPDTTPSILPTYKKLIAAGLRIWVYSGDTDGKLPVLATRYSINSLGLPIVKAWRPWYHEGQVSGWYQEYKGLTFGTFRGAGHAVPTFKPSSSLAMFASFLQGGSLQSARTST